MKPLLGGAKDPGFTMLLDGYETVDGVDMNATPHPFRRDFTSLVSYASSHAQQLEDVLHGPVLRPQQLLDEGSKLSDGAERANYFSRQQQGWNRNQNTGSEGGAECKSRHKLLTNAIDPEMQRQVELS
jgi:hypothetical protein